MILVNYLDSTIKKKTEKNILSEFGQIWVGNFTARLIFTVKFPHASFSLL